MKVPEGMFTTLLGSSPCHMKGPCRGTRIFVFGPKAADSTTVRDRSTSSIAVPPNAICPTSRVVGGKSSLTREGQSRNAYPKIFSKAVQPDVSTPDSLQHNWKK